MDMYQGGYCAGYCFCMWTFVSRSMWAANRRKLDFGYIRDSVGFTDDLYHTIKITTEYVANGCLEH